MIIFRYLAKEVFVTLLALTLILLFIFLSNQLVQYVSRAAGGEIPAMFILQLLFLELRGFIGLLLPLGFYIALLLAYGRLYAESEMIALSAGGFGFYKWFGINLIFACCVACLTAYMVFIVGPGIAEQRSKLLRTTGVQVLVKTLQPKQFRALPKGEGVFYVGALNNKKNKAKDIFLAAFSSHDALKQWQIVHAQSAYTKSSNGEDYLVLEKGSMYLGDPGHAMSDVSSFKQLTLRLPHPSFTYKSTDFRHVKTSSLWHLKNHSLDALAEFQWRCSIPIMVFILMALALPLSRVNPRAGKYGKLFPALLLFFFYVNFLFISRGWIISGVIPGWVGLWWVHLLMVLCALLLILKNR